jgi:hypothetical protein
MTGALRRPTSVAAGLVAATLLTWWLGTHHPAAPGGARLAAVAAIGVAMVKVHYVGMDFMELRTANPVLRRLFSGWVTVLGAVLVTVQLSWGVHLA